MVRFLSSGSFAAQLVLLPDRNDSIMGLISLTYWSWKMSLLKVKIVAWSGGLIVERFIWKKVLANPANTHCGLRSLSQYRLGGLRGFRTCNNGVVWAKFRLMELGSCLSKGAVGGDWACSALWDSEACSSFQFAVISVELISGGNRLWSSCPGWSWQGQSTVLWCGKEGVRMRGGCRVAGEAEHDIVLLQTLGCSWSGGCTGFYWEYQDLARRLFWTRKQKYS